MHWGCRQPGPVRTGTSERSIELFGPTPRTAVPLVTPQTMQGIVANLERARLLERSIDPSHGRILRGELTKKGAKILREAHAQVKKIEAVTFGSLSPAEIEVLTTRLIACAEALDRETLVRRST